jgi:hypothetical protein
MRGEQPDIRDVELNLESLILPENLLSNESLSPDTEGEEEEELFPYRIDSCCYSCGTGVRLCVVASNTAIRDLQQLLLVGLNLLCPGCSRQQVHHGRTG